jgi:FtsH-binding integral membrane protein
METPAIRDTIVALVRPGVSMLILLFGLMAVMWFASSLAHNSPSIGTQYFGLGLSVTAHAVLFTLLLTFAERVAPGVSQSAAILTLAIFATLTAVVWYTGANFNWLSPILWAASIAAFVAVLLSIFMGLSLGPWFAAAMIVVASGYILYFTSSIMREYPTTAYVGAALALFTAVADLFYWVVRLLMQLRDGD